MVDAPARGGGDRRLGAEGDPEPGRRQASAGRWRHRRQRASPIARRRIPRPAPASVSRLVSPVTIGARTVPAIRPSAIRSRLATTRSKPSSARHPLGEDGEPARNQGGAHPGRPRGRDQRTRPRHQPDARGRLVEHRLRQILQQRDPLGERGGEIELAVHRPPGDLGDMRRAARRNRPVRRASRSR